MTVLVLRNNGRHSGMSASSADEDAERRAAEHTALSSIYDDLEGDVGGPWRVPIGVGGAILEVHVPTDYPSNSAPTPLLFGDFLTDEQRTRLCAELMELYTGDEVVFTWAEHLREALEQDANLDITLSAAVAAAALDDATAACDDAALAAALAAESSAPAIDVADIGGAEQAAAVGFTFTPATSRYGQRVRHFEAAHCDERFGVEITRGPSFHPPKSGPSEEFQAFVASVTSMEQVRTHHLHGPARAAHSNLQWHCHANARPPLLTTWLW